jgi:hypothetical protein
MCDPTLVIRWGNDDYWPSDWYETPLAFQISGMERNDISALYSDFRSPSRSARHHLRRRQQVLNPIQRNKHCDHTCLPYSKRHPSGRRRRWGAVEVECTEDSYWDKECAELNYREQYMASDPVTLYYNHGRNAAVIESLRPKPEDFADEAEQDDAQDWVSVLGSNAAEAKVQVVRSRDWTLHVYSPSVCMPSETHNSTLVPALLGRCVGDETTFTFHRNASGLWELGYANQWLVDASTDPHGCTQLPLAIECGCCSSNRGFFPCSCSAFPAGWRSPEDNWQGGLMEWISEAVEQRISLLDETDEPKRQGIGFELASYQAAADEHDVGGGLVDKGRGSEWTFVRTPRAKQTDSEEWDVVSSLSSTGSWRVVDVT